MAECSTAKAQLSPPETYQARRAGIRGAILVLIPQPSDFGFIGDFARSGVSKRGCSWCDAGEKLTSYVSFRLGYGTVTYATVGRETRDRDERMDATNRGRRQ